MAALEDGPTLIYHLTIIVGFRFIFYPTLVNGSVVFPFAYYSAVPTIGVRNSADFVIDVGRFILAMWNFGIVVVFELKRKVVGGYW